MKIGILSMQRIVNYGSFLQAYALKQCFLERGCEVEFVDYHCVKNDDSNEKQNIYKNLVAKGRTVAGLLFAQINKAYAEKRCRAHLVNVFNSRFPQYAKEKLCLIPNNYNPKVDILIIGSDEVFNLTQKNPEVGCSFELLGKDNNAQYVFSYAASFGNTTIQKLEDTGIADEVAYYLNKFTDISCRDKNSQDIVTHLTHRITKKHIDPVLLYDFTQEMSAESEGEIDIRINKPYLLVYSYANRINEQEEIAIKQFAKERNLLILTCGMIQGFEDVYIPAMPFDLLRYFKNAAYVVTDTFHGAILSVKFNKNFVTFVRASTEKNYGNQEKLEDFIHTAGLEDRIVRDIGEFACILSDEIDYGGVNTILKEERQKAYSYLDEICCTHVRGQ